MSSSHVSVTTSASGTISSGTITTTSTASMASTSSSSSGPMTSISSSTVATTSSSTLSSSSSSSSPSSSSSSSSSTSMSSSSSSDPPLSGTSTSSSTTSSTSTSSSSTTSSSTSSSSSSSTSTPIPPPSTSPPTSTPPTSTPTPTPPTPTPSPPTPHSSSSTAPKIPPSTTLSSLVFVPTTDSQGQTSSFAPSVITDISTSTKQDGSATTITQVSANFPTLSPDDASSRDSAFFRNTGAVAGVFVLVGLAAASILLWIFFAVRRRRRTLRLEYDTAVSATLAAAGFHRTPLDDDDDPAAGSHRDSSRSRYASDPDPFGVGRQNRSSSGLAMSSIPSAGRASAYIDGPHTPDDVDYNPYTDYVVPAGSRDGYISGSGVGTVPPPSAFALRDRRSSGGLAEMGALGQTHHHQNSSGSYEPLLASYYATARSNGATPPSPNPNTPISTGAPPTPSQPDAAAIRYPPAYRDGGQPTRTSSHEPLVQITSAASSVYSDDDGNSMRDDRLDPGIRQRLQDHDGESANDLRDEEDYSRPVLGVRNLPDAASVVSI